MLTQIYFCFEILSDINMSFDTNISCDSKCTRVFAINNYGWLVNFVVIRSYFITKETRLQIYSLEALPEFLMVLARKLTTPKVQVSKSDHGYIYWSDYIRWCKCIHKWRHIRDCKYFSDIYSVNGIYSSNIHSVSMNILA